MLVLARQPEQSILISAGTSIGYDTRIRVDSISDGSVCFTITDREGVVSRIESGIGSGRIHVHDDVEMVIVDVKVGRVRLGFKAPRGVRIWREGEWGGEGPYTSGNTAPLKPPPSGLSGMAEPPEKE
jgi:sRNA-binding carbon storage regulator CsrA